MAERDFDWFLQDTEAYNALTVEQLHILGQGGTIDWDEAAAAPVATKTETTSEDAAAAAAAAAETTATPAAATETATPPPNPELDAAVARAKELEQLNEQQSELIKNLQGAQKVDETTGGTQAQEDVLAEFAKDFPEIAEKLGPALNKLVEQGVTAKTADIQAKLDAALKPLQENAEDAALNAHFDTIVDAIPDFETIRDSGEVEKWLEKQPSYIRTAGEKVLAEGTATEVIELLTEYKSSLGKPPESPRLSKEEAEKKAAEAVKNAKSGVPASSTDIPTAGVQTSPEDPTTVDGWSRKFAGMDPSAILKAL